MRAGDRITVTAERLDDLGRGIGEVAGRAVHVRDLQPGEQARVVIEHVSPHRAVAFAAIEERIGASSSARVSPACPGFGRCGGCALQAMDGAAQLEAKRARVAEALAAVPGAPAVPAVVPAPAALGYRNRASYVVGGRVGEVALGAYRPASHDFVETLGCRAVDPLIDELAVAVAAGLSRTGLSPYREGERAGHLRYVVIRVSRAGRALIGLVTAPSAPRAPLAALAAALIGDPRAVGVVWVRNPATSSALLAGERETLAGAPTVRERVSGVEVDLDLGDFTQVNLPAAERLVDAVVARGGGAARVIDLYAGVGAFAFAFAARGAEVVAIERNAGAVEAGRAAAAAAGLAAVSFVAGDAGALRELAGPADLVVVNPPRKGLDGATRVALAARRPPAIAYVSCEPTSLARDLVALGEVGYRITWLQPFDLMPGAGPIETAVYLEL